MCIDSYNLNCGKMGSLDINSLFLQGKENTQDLFIKPTTVAGYKYLWQLNKISNGL